MEKLYTYNYYDTHAHYDDERYDSDRNEIIQSVYSRGCKKIINIGCTLERSEKSLELSKKYDFVYYTVGIHPSDVVNTPDNYLEKLRELSGYPKCVGVGEIGLDYTVFEGEKPDKVRQERFFREQLALARELSLPVVIHSRDAAEDTLRILRDEMKKGEFRGVMHCYSYSAEVAKTVLALGLHISFTGVITFKNARKTLESLSAVPIDRLLTETDCPYMSPEPERGKRNDSGKIPYIIAKMTEIYNLSPKEIADRTMENAERLFKFM
ncbi:MAG: TatD family hydrolase [Ruminococcus sp.]|jgi:TatD DNase family protein|nr:TatD family hydrolase [Ruminococcus sp.]